MAFYPSYDYLKLHNRYYFDFKNYALTKTAVIPTGRLPAKYAKLRSNTSGSNTNSTNSGKYKASSASSACSSGYGSSTSSPLPQPLYNPYNPYKTNNPTKSFGNSKSLPYPFLPPTPAYTPSHNAGLYRQEVYASYYIVNTGTPYLGPRTSTLWIPPNVNHDDFVQITYPVTYHYQPYNWGPHPCDYTCAQNHQ